VIWVTLNSSTGWLGWRLRGREERGPKEPSPIHLIEQPPFKYEPEPESRADLAIMWMIRTAIALVSVAFLVSILGLLVENGF
jgi:hypothetical protein